MNNPVCLSLHLIRQEYPIRLLVLFLTISARPSFHVFVAVLRRLRSMMTGSNIYLLVGAKSIIKAISPLPLWGVSFPLSRSAVLINESIMLP